MATQKDLSVVEVNSPDRGLVSRYPSNISAKNQKGSIVRGSNIRAEDHMLRNSPGYERVASSGDVLDSPPNRIYQSNIISQDLENQTAPLIGTEGKVFAITRRSEDLVCPIDSRRCSVKFAFIGNSGYLDTGAVDTQPISQVAELVAREAPDYVVSLGGTIVACPAADPTWESPYETLVAQFYGQYIEGYSGKYGQGSETQRFFPAVGAGDYLDSGALWSDFFRLPSNELYYSVRIGPAELFFLNSGPEALAQAQLDWLTAGLHNSTAEWPIVVLAKPPYSSTAGVSAYRADFEALGAKMVISGTSKNYERLRLTPTGIPYLVCGLGGDPTISTIGTPATESVAHYDAGHGVLILTVDFSVAATKFVPVSGDVVDEVSFTAPSTAGSGICYLSESPATRSTITKLVVEPPAVTLEVGQDWDFTATAYYPDGTFEDVTRVAFWESGDPTIAAVSAGRARGVAFGPTTAQATFLGVSAHADVTVVAACTPPARDIVLVVERSTSMGDFSGDSTKYGYATEFARQLAERLHTSDRVALITYAGAYSTQVSDVSVEVGFTAEFSDVVTAMETRAPAGGCATAAALGAAQALFDSARTDSDKIIVLVTDGAADIVDETTPADRPAAITAAMAAVGTCVSSIESDEIELVVVGYSLPTDYSAEILGWASGMDFPVDYHSFVPLATQVLNYTCRYPMVEDTSPPEVVTSYDGGFTPSEYYWSADYTVWDSEAIPDEMAGQLPYMWAAFQYQIQRSGRSGTFRQLAWAGTTSALTARSATLKYSSENPMAFDWDADGVAATSGGFTSPLGTHLALYGIDPIPFTKKSSRSIPGLDYKTFLNWKITDGTVDLCGTGRDKSLFDAFPGQGFGCYVDLCGSGTGNRFEGTMETKSSFLFKAGMTYRVSADFAGPNRAAAQVPGLSVSVSIEGLVSGVVSYDTVASLSTPFTTHSWEFTPTADVTLPLVIRMNTLPAGAPSSMGVWLDNVVIERLSEDSPADPILFSDGFEGDGELPPIP